MVPRLTVRPLRLTRVGTCTSKLARASPSLAAHDTSLTR